MGFVAPVPAVSTFQTVRLFAVGQYMSSRMGSSKVSVGSSSTR